ncbi:MAG: hypothetical protein COZ20_06810 [Gallionellales bacterium CG_4_10_14_3_um_filter_54_96]|nr:MAG: hypothetical protein COX56_00305 [Zetaproteobacteria bacterium CG23_combo_of_CG06-09_8_20_14_all_59_86]PIY04020.1 MAG: hypothetical protein COZ20_06810 [Gallionellales bacterium CG_4_10_14_3_um_filter_54_96]PJC19087.1 MAG: hypothetical protein CO062_01285 [Zetaproteobacteria bacterium CG_4_9_14_0_2_um_filter_59_191]
MKPIMISVSNDTSADSAVQYVESRIPEASKRASEFSVIFPQVKSCIEDFSEKARKLAIDGTTIHIKKEFSLPGVSVVVLLQYPRKVGFLEKIVRVLKRG